MYVPTPIKPARRKAVLRAVSDGRRLGIATTALESPAGAFRALNSHWFGPRRQWVFRCPIDGQRLARQLAEAFPTAYLDLDDLPAVIEGAQATPTPDYFTEMLDLQIIPLDQPGHHAVSGAYDSYFIDAMRALRGRFHKYAQAWDVAGSVAQILDALQRIAGVDPLHVFVHEHVMHLEDLVSKPKAEMPISVPGAAPVFGDGAGVGDEEEGSGFLSSCARPLEHLPVDEAMLARAAIDCGLMDHQPAGVRHFLARSSALLADDMGLGKTRQAVVASRLAAGEQGRILVTCPASLRINWEREIHMVFPNDVVGMVGDDRMSTLPACRWVIANFERLGGLVRASIDFEVFTVDEAHNLKEHNAGRTRNAFILAERIPRRFLLTGTPILNREIEMHTLLRLSGHPIGMLELREFRKQYSGGQGQRQALAEAVADWMLRRSKKVLKGLGKKTHQVRYVTPAEGLDEYQRILADMTLPVMPKITKLRQHLEIIKTDFLIETVQSLQADDKVIIFCEYMPTVDFMKESFKNAGIDCVTLVGSDNGSSRQRAVDAFQQNPAVRVFIGTSAAAVGITLTAANYVILASQPWTPAMQRQREDRAYRNGQTRDVFVIIPVIPGTIDEQVLALLGSKTEIEESVIENAVRAHLARCPPAPRRGDPPLPSTPVSRMSSH